MELQTKIKETLKNFCKRPLIPEIKLPIKVRNKSRKTKKSRKKQTFTIAIRRKIAL